MSYDLLTGALKMFNSFSGADTGIKPLFCRHSSLKELESHFSLSQIAGKGDTFSRAYHLLIWISAHIYHKGDYDSRLTNAIDLLDYSFDKGPEFGINCRSLSVTMMESCLSVGIFARQMFLMPLSPYDGDNHVVCEIWLPEENRWVMMDPSYGGYLTDESGKALDLLQLRECLGNQGEVSFSEGFHYNGDRNLDFEDIKTYYAKNLFYFRCLQVQTFDVEHISGNQMLYFVPAGYDPIRSQLACIEYKERRYGPHPWLTERKAVLAKENAVLCGKTALTAAPEWMDER